MLQHNLRQQSGAQGALRDAMVVVDVTVSRGPLREPFGESLAKRSIAARGFEEMPQNIVVDTIVTCRQVETRSVSEPCLNASRHASLKSFVPRAPLAVKPHTCLASIKVPERFIVVAVADTLREMFCHHVCCRLIDNLVFDCEERIRPKHSRGFWNENLPGR